MDFLRVCGKNTSHQAFNPEKYSHNRLAQMARLMKTWGWMPSHWQNDETTEYYFIHRQLCFHASLAILRHHILDGMNGLMERLNQPYRISISGLPTESEIYDYIDNLRQGKISFREVFDLIYQL